MYAPNMTLNPFAQLNLDIKETVYACDDCGWAGLGSSLYNVKINGANFCSCPNCTNLDVRPFNTEQE